MRLVKWLVGIVLILGILVGASPLAAKWALQYWLKSHGYQSQIKQLSMNYLLGGVRLRGVEVASADGERLDLFEVEVELQLRALFERRLVLQRVKLSSVRADVQRREQQVIVAGMPIRDWLPALSDHRWTVELGRLQVEHLELCRTQYQQCLRLESLSVANAQWVPDSEGWQFEHALPLIANRVFLRDQLSNTSIFYLGHLRIARSQHTRQGVELDGIRASNFHFVEAVNLGRLLETPYQMQIGELEVSQLGVRYHQPKVQLGDVAATSVRQALLKDGEAKFILPARLRGWFPGLAELATSGQKPGFSMQSLKLRGGALAWFDYSVLPIARESMSRINLTLGPVDSEDSNVATPIQLSAQVGHQGSVKLSGVVSPFSESLQFQLAGFVDNLELANISAYTRSVMGQAVVSGTLSGSGRVQAINNEVDAETRWRLTGIGLESNTGWEREMPLTQVLDLLSDHNQSVELELPVRGNALRDDLSLNYVFGTLMRRTLNDLARTK